jgi:hypothetical protein
MVMAYVVVKVGQLKEYAHRSVAADEAVRLAEKHNGNFYVAELKEITITVSKIVIAPINSENIPLPDNCGKRWTDRDEQYLMSLWMSGNTISFIANRLHRTEEGIRCRLEHLGFDGRTWNTYKGR